MTKITIKEPIIDTFEAKNCGGITPIRDMLYFERIELKQFCHWKVIENTEKKKVIIFEVYYEPNNH